jgi:hypothetical protein
MKSLLTASAVIIGLGLTSPASAQTPTPRDPGRSSPLAARDTVQTSPLAKDPAKDSPLAAKDVGQESPRGRSRVIASQRVKARVLSPREWGVAHTTISRA